MRLARVRASTRCSSARATGRVVERFDPTRHRPVRRAGGGDCRALHIKFRANADSLQADHVPPIAAHEAYLRGLSNLNQSSEPALRAIESFNQAVSLDTEHARAHAGLATAYTYPRRDLFVAPAVHIRRRSARPIARSSSTLRPPDGHPRRRSASTSSSTTPIRKRRRRCSIRRFVRIPVGAAVRASLVVRARDAPAKRAVVAAQRALKLDPLSAMTISSSGGGSWRASPIRRSLSIAAR